MQEKVKEKECLARIKENRSQGREIKGKRIRRGKSKGQGELGKEKVQETGT